eukprot:11131995-Ditylum_brightwellii.AAC.1
MVRPPPEPPPVHNGAAGMVTEHMKPKTPRNTNRKHNPTTGNTPQHQPRTPQMRNAWKKAFC